MGTQLHSRIGRRSFVLLIALMLMLSTWGTAFTRPAYADAGGRLSGTGDIEFQEMDEAPVLVTPGLTLTGFDGFDTTSYIEYEIEAAQSTDHLSVKRAASEAEIATEIDKVSIFGNTVYLGTGDGYDAIAGIDSVYNGQSGSKLRISFSRELDNANFQSGPMNVNFNDSLELPGWEVSHGTFNLTNSGLNLRTLGRPYTSITQNGSLYTVQYTDAETSTAYSYETDVNYNTNAAWLYEGMERPVGTLNTQVMIVQDTGASGDRALQLTSNGSVVSNNGTPPKYGSHFGPVVRSSVFHARQGEKLSLDWKAIRGSDHYEVYGYIQNVNNPTEYSLLIYGRGSDTSGWQTVEGTIPSDGAFRFIFINGTYDSTGGFAVGSTMWIDNIQVYGNEIYPEQIVEQILQLVTYQSTDKDPETAGKTLNITVSDRSKQEVTGQLEIFITDHFKHPPEIQVTSQNPVADNTGSKNGKLFSSVNVTTVEDEDRFVELQMTVTGLVNGEHEILTIDGTDVKLINKQYGTTAGSKATYLVTRTGGTATITLALKLLTDAQLGELIDGLTYKNLLPDLTEGVRTFTITGLKDNAALVDAKDANASALNISSAVSVLDKAGPTGYSVSFDQTSVDAANEESISFTIHDATAGSTYVYTIRDGNGDTRTGQGTINESSQTISGIDVSQLANGLLTLEVTLKDAKGNAGSSVTDTVTKDILFRVDQAYINSSNQQSLSFTLNDVEVGSTYFYTIATSGGSETVSGIGVVTSSTHKVGPIDVSGLHDGQLTVTVSMTDIRDQTGPTASDTVVKVTRAPSAPTTHMETSREGYINQADMPNLPVTGSAEPYTVISVELEDENGHKITRQATADENGRWQLEVDASGLDDGAITIRAAAADEYGNPSAPDEVVLTKDTSAPAIGGLDPDTEDWTNQDVTISVTADEGSGVALIKYAAGDQDASFFENGGIRVSEGAFAVTANGIYTVYVQDLAGNGTVRMIDVTNIDTVKPDAPSIVKLPDVDFYNDDLVITIIGGADDESGVSLTQVRTVTESVYGTSDSGWFPYTAPFSITDEGKTTVYAETIDQAGNISVQAEAKIAIHRELKVAAVVSIDPDVTYSNTDYTVSISLQDLDSTATEATYATVKYRYTGMPDYEEYTGPFTISAEGDYELMVLLIDRYGNESTVTRTIHVDKTAPTNQNEILAETVTVKSGDLTRIPIQPSQDASDTIWIAPKGTTNFVEGSEMKKATGDSNQISLPDEDGEYVIYVIDAAGNISQASDASVVIDRTPPAVEGIADGSVAKHYPTITFDDGTAALNGVPFTSGSRIEANGTYTLVVTDEHGNVTRIAFVVDNDQETVETVAQDVTIGYADGDGPSRVTESLSLPTTGDQETTVVWESSHPNIIGADGQIIAYPAVNTSVTLTAHVNKGDATTTKTFTIIVYADAVAPVITLLGSAEVTLTVGDLYVEAGYSAIDAAEGNLTALVERTGYFNTQKTGVYTLTYTVTDRSGNTASVTRTIHVVAKSVPSSTVVEADRDETVLDEKIGGAIEGAKQNNSSNITIVVDDVVETEHDIHVSISREMVREAQENNLRLTLQTGNTSLEVPLSAVDLDALGTTSRLQMVIEKLDVTKTENQDMVDAVKDIHESLEIYKGNVYDFSVKIVEEDANGNVIRDEVIENFTTSDDIQLSIRVGAKDSEDYFMTYYYNVATGKWEYVRSSYDEASGEVKLLTKHLSIYSVMSMTKQQKLAELTKIINDPAITPEEVLNILEDEDLDFAERSVFELFNQSQKEQAAEDVIDHRPAGGYADYDDLEADLSEIVRNIHQLVSGDTVPPQIILAGDSRITLRVGGVYTERGATASDNLEGDLTGRIVIYGKVDTSKAGTYTLRYVITDLAGNTSEVIRTVVVSGSSPVFVPPVELQDEETDDALQIISGEQTVIVRQASGEGLMPNASGMSIVSGIYEIERAEGTDAVNAVIRIAYDPNLVGDASKLGIFVYDEAEGKWRYVGGKVDQTNHVITLDLAISGKIAVVENIVTFPDIQGHWAQDVIELLASRQILTGDASGNFNPNIGITRAEFSTIIVRGLGLDASHESTGFADIEDDAWYAPYIAAARQAGVVKGVSDTEFQPDRIVTRQEMAAIALRAYQVLQPVDEWQYDDADRFLDDPSISNWAKEDVYKAKALKLVKGRSATLFVPEVDTLRAEAAIIIYNLLSSLGKL